MISREEIKLKEKYILDCLEKELDKNEINKDRLDEMKFSLLAYLSLDYIELINQPLRFLLKEILLGYAPLNKKCSEIRENILKTIKIDIPKISDEYIYFLIELLNNLTRIKIDYSNDCKELSYYPFKSYSIISTSYLFYNYLNDIDFLDISGNILGNSSHYDFKDKIFSNGITKIAGTTKYDYYFNKPYFICEKSNNLSVYQVFNHEMMHAIELYISPKKRLMSSVFREISPYTMDHLFLDFLEQNNYNINDVNALRRRQYAYVKGLSCYVLNNLFNRFECKYGEISDDTINYENIRSILTTEMLRRMFEIVSCVVAEGLYRQILVNKKQGLTNLKSLIMNYNFEDDVPDFSFVGLSNKKLIKISEKMCKK